MIDITEILYWKQNHAVHNNKLLTKTSVNGVHWLENQCFLHKQTYASRTFSEEDVLYHISKKKKNC